MTRHRAGRARSFISLRIKFLGVVLGAALAPLAVLGFWMAHSAERSGGRLLRTQLDTALARVARDVGARWVRERSALLMIAENAELRQALTGDTDRAPRDIAIAMSRSAAGILRNDVQLVFARDSLRGTRWLLTSADDSGPPRLVRGEDAERSGPEQSGVAVVLPVSAPSSSQSVGTVEAWLRASALIESAAASSAGAGTVLAVIDRASGTSLVPLPFDPTLLAAERFVWAGEEWLAVRRELDEPAITLVAAAPTAPFIVPFQQAARAGSLTLGGVTLTAFLLTLFLTGRLTGSLERLAGAADAVARGNLDQRVDAPEADEVGRVAHAFNTMTESLRHTLGRLAQHEAVAAVGELAATLAHEVRNPLSAIRLHLQHAEEQLDVESPVAKSVSRALHDVARLERTVAGTLRIAQSGRMELEPVDLRAAIDAACRAAVGEFIALKAVLEPLPEPRTPLRILGNAAALEQAAVNLLLNAAQAIEPGGRVGLEVSASPTEYTVTVWDTGPGLAPAELERAFEPFYSTKPEGTGLGLSIVRRIVSAHGGQVAIESALGAGTRVRVTLPALVE